MEWTPQLVAGLVLLAFASEYVDSSLGMGYGTTLTPLLLLLGFEPLEAVPAVLLSEVVTGFAAASLHHGVRNVTFKRGTPETRSAVWLSVLGLVGSAFAVAIAAHVPKQAVTTYIGLMVLSMGVLMLVVRQRPRKLSWPRIAGVGLLAAFNKAIGGGGYGTLVTGGQILSGLDARKAVSVTSLAEAVVSLAGIAGYALLVGDVPWRLAGVLLAGALLSVPLSVLTIRKLAHKRLQLAIGVASCALGVLVIVRVAPA